MAETRALGIADEEGYERMKWSSSKIADAVPNHWVMRHVPETFLPYAQLMRLDRPIGWWLLLLPCWWGLLLAQLAQGGGWPNLWYGFLFFLGAVVMRGAGCTLNDIADREIDGQVARTRGRPLPSGRVTLRQAFIFLLLQCLLGLVILLQFNWPTVILGASSLLIVAIYPFMKRITYWPQAVLGLAFNWGALMGWMAVTGSLALAPILLYLGGIFWTLGYDTIYAHQDKEDDLLIGVKSTALRFGDKTPLWLCWFYGLAVVSIAGALALVQASLLSYLGLLLAGLQAWWQIKNFQADHSAQCLKLFKSNRSFGLILVLFMMLDCVWR